MTFKALRLSHGVIVSHQSVNLFGMLSINDYASAATLTWLKVRQVKSKASYCLIGLFQIVLDHQSHYSETPFRFIIGDAINDCRYAVIILLG